MAKESVDHVELLHPEAVAAVPNLGLGDVLKYLPILEKPVTTFTTGTGTFSSWSPRGKVWVRVRNHEFPEVT